jgi:hypothetical protein
MLYLRISKHLTDDWAFFGLPSFPKHCEFPKKCTFYANKCEQVSANRQSGEARHDSEKSTKLRCRVGNTVNDVEVSWIPLHISASRSVALSEAFRHFLQSLHNQSRTVLQAKLRLFLSALFHIQNSHVILRPAINRTVK